jgi:glycine betaine/proline transport system substrate-binding protein
MCFCAAHTLPLIGAKLRCYGRPVRTAQSPSTTGHFQAEIYRQLLEEIGCAVEPVVTMESAAFYEAAALGYVDFWANGWFPQHNVFRDNQLIAENTELIGYQVHTGVFQGYLIDKQTAIREGITNLADLQDPELATLFDTDGNGKADLIGCNEGWDCAAVIEHHLKEYDLTDTVEQVQGEYNDLMRDALERYINGEPILFYTWTPNWPVNELAPGADVVWLEVPYTSLPEKMSALEDLTLVTNIEGCNTDPCNLGFPSNDIRVVANTDFLADPMIRRLLGLVEIPLEDITSQNAAIFFGEDSKADIQRHAENWIAGNRDQVDEWLTMASGAQAISFTDHTDAVYNLVFSPDGTTLASGSADNTIILWDMVLGQRLVTLEAHTDDVTTVAFSPDGTTLASGSQDQTIILWEVDSGQQIGEPLQGHTSGVSSVAFSPDGTTLVSASDDQTIRLWEVATGQPRGDPLQGHTSAVRSAAFSPDGQILASGSSDQTIRLWEVATGQPLGEPLTGHMNDISSVAFNSNGSRILTWSRDGTAMVWDAQTGEVLVRLPHEAEVNGAAWNADETRILTWSRDSTARVWDTQTGNELTRLGHEATVWDATWDANENRILTASEDSTALVWDATTGEQVLAFLGHETSVTNIAVSPNNEYALSVSGDGILKLWDARPIEEIVTDLCASHYNLPDWEEVVRQQYSVPDDLYLCPAQ